MGNAMSAAYRFVKRYDCLDLPDAEDPNAPPRTESGDSDAGSRHGGASGTGGGSANGTSGGTASCTSTRDMPATLSGVKVSTREFDGRRFSRHYVLGKKIGEGAFSEVYEARSRVGSSKAAEVTWDGPFAVKRTTKKGLAKEDEKGLSEEVRILRMLQHSNVVNVYQFFRDDPDYYYMVMEYMAGGELFNRIVQKMFYNEEEARDLCRVLLESVRYCHELGIVHRDLKPENLLLVSESNDLDIKLADFGFACSVLNGKVADQCGSPGYVAPEILKAKPYGTAVDMWSIGVIIYTLLGGYPPFHDENQTRLFRRIKAGSFKFHDEYWSDTSAEAKDLIRKLLIVDPDKRITATEAVDHPWLLTKGDQLAGHNLGKNLDQLRIFNATRKLRAAIKTVIATKNLTKSLGISTF